MAEREYRPLHPAQQRPVAYVHETYLGSISLPALQVYEPEDAWQRTGILDASGTELMRRDVRQPIGFLGRTDAGNAKPRRA